MSERYPGGLIRKTPPTVTPPVAGEGGSASGVWTLADVLTYEKVNGWPKPILPRSLYAWGSNYAGRLGDGTVVSKSSPVQIGALTNWVQVSANFAHNACVTTTGTLFTWGDGANGRLGHNDVVSRSSPVQVGALTNWAQASTGGNWGTACLKTDGTLWTWGGNANGQLGQNDLVSRSSPVQVGALTNWAQVAAGNFTGTHILCIKTDGTLWAWGYNREGQLGLGNTLPRSSPVQVGSLTNWARASAGQNHTACVTTSGTLFTWGYGTFGRLGRNSNISNSSPIQVGALTNWSQVSAGGYHTACVTTAGTLFTWGQNYNVGAYGQLGDGTVINRSSPVQVGALSNWAQVSAGGRFTACTTTAGTLFAWGSGSSGQLGQNNTISLSSPVQVGAITNWSQVSAGGFSTLAITKG